MKQAVLIVEDDTTVREMMDIVLTQAGFHVLSTSNGDSALDLVRRTTFRLILLDIHMPRTSGLDVLVAINRLPKTPPVLMVSANRESDTVQKAVGLGCAGYLVKPFSPAVLVERVRRAIAGPTPLMLN